jgi:hypothetical protein
MAITMELSEAVEAAKIGMDVLKRFLQLENVFTKTSIMTFKCTIHWLE